MHHQGLLRGPIDTVPPANRPSTLPKTLDQPIGFSFVFVLVKNAEKHIINNFLFFLFGFFSLRGMGGRGTDGRVLHKQGGEGRRRKNGEKTEESETISHLPMYGYDGTSIFDQSQNQHNQTPLILTQHLHLPAFALVQTAC